jgi:hypothetical protein
MSLITLDFETYYTDKLGFSKQTTEEYIRDSQFEIIGVGVTQDDHPATWLSGSKEEIREHLLTYDWDNSALLCHNTMFDGAILKWVLGIEPAFYLDTLCMARAIHGVEAGGSLAALAKRYNIGEKGTEVVAAKGKRRADFTPLELEAYGAYCKNDAELTRKLFYILSNNFSEDETRLIDMTLRMYIDPVFLVDDALLVARLEELKRDKLELLSTLMDKLSCDTEEAVRKKLASNKQFAEILKSFGIEPPMKTSPATGKQAPALAKTDEGFIELQEHEDPVVQQLCAVRLGTKSTIEESRIERFINIGGRNGGLLPIPLKYYGAHTGRWSGQDGINMQNLPSRDKRKKALKNAIVPPDGHFIVNCDSSQIEARVLAWWAGQDDVVQQFANGEDVYSTFATKIYKRPISKADPVERFVGKTCVGIGSKVLCESGWIPIEQVRLSDRVWDGQEWVCHSGVVLNGTKQTLQLYGLSLTPDHLVWSGTWQRADYLLQDTDTLFQALGIAAANLPSQAIWLEQEVSAHSLLDAIVGQTSTRLALTISKCLDRLAAICVRDKQRVRNAIGSTLKQCRTMLIGLDSSIAYPQPLLAATLRPTESTYITDSVESMSTKHGELIAQSSYAMSKPLKGGIFPASKWIVSTTTQGTHRGISDLYQDQSTHPTREASQTLKPVYDILNSG